MTQSKQNRKLKSWISPQITILSGSNIEAKTNVQPAEGTSGGAVRCQGATTAPNTVYNFAFIPGTAPTSGGFNPGRWGAYVGPYGGQTGNGNARSDTATVNVTAGGACTYVGPNTTFMGVLTDRSAADNGPS